MWHDADINYCHFFKKYKAQNEEPDIIFQLATVTVQGFSLILNKQKFILFQILLMPSVLLNGTLRSRDLALM